METLTKQFQSRWPGLFDDESTGTEHGRGHLRPAVSSTTSAHRAVAEHGLRADGQWELPQADPARRSRAVGWVEEEVNERIHEQIAESRGEVESLAHRALVTEPR